ncbi:PREDICTED: mucin-19-like isoform X2 [Eufriesea mexicana]|uniref:mucin-19-like isoform X2 n=1 Tax=Eufriesea mexicana TaxID=516756 RepID=UPI00083C3120|nr:PREDICTED: mucin-19-like isoform X2 [Eufriesea mexicana]
MIDRTSLVVLLGLLSLTCGLQCPKQRQSPGREVVCYTSASNVQQLTEAVCKCTTLVQQGHDVQNLSISEFEDFRKSLKEIIPPLQFVVSVDDPGQTLRTSGTVRQEIIARLIGVLKEVDGVELNMTAGTKERLVQFVTDLKDELTRKSYDKRIFLVLPTKSEDMAKQFDLKKLSKYVDLFTIPTHYLIEDDEAYRTFHPSRLMGLFDMFNADSLIDLISGLGAPKRKILMSLPANAYEFTLKDQDDNAPRAPSEEMQPVIIDQKQLCDLMKGGEWTVERDEDLTAPYAFKDKKWIAFEDRISVAIKGKYALLRDLPGLAIHDIENDYKTDCGMTLTHNIHHSFSDFKRKSRAAVLNALEDDLHQKELEYPTKVKSSDFRVVRVVDTEGHIRVVRENTQTEFTCSRQGYFVHPKSCNRFYRCVKFNQEVEDYSVFEFDCPAGLSFDERTEVCVWPGSMPEGSPCPGSSEIAPVARVRFECPAKSGYYADPQNPRWFFACIDLGGPEIMAYEFRCPFGLIFDEQKLVCEWPWLVVGYSGTDYTRSQYDNRVYGTGSTPGTGGYYTGGLPHGYTGTAGGGYTVSTGDIGHAGVGYTGDHGSAFGQGTAGTGHTGSATGGTSYTGQLPGGYTGATGTGYSGAAGVGGHRTSYGGQGSGVYTGTTGSGYSGAAGAGSQGTTYDGQGSVYTGATGSVYSGTAGAGGHKTSYGGQGSGVYTGTTGSGYSGGAGGQGTAYGGQGSGVYTGTGSGQSGTARAGSQGTTYGGQGSGVYSGTTGSVYSGAAGSGGHGTPYGGQVPGGGSGTTGGGFPGSGASQTGTGHEYSGTIGTGQVSTGIGYTGAGSIGHSGTSGVYTGTTGTGYTPDKGHSGQSPIGHGTGSGSIDGGYSGATGGVHGGSSGGYVGTSGIHGGSTTGIYSGTTSGAHAGSTGGYVGPGGVHGGSTGTSYTGPGAGGYTGSSGAHAGATGGFSGGSSGTPIIVTEDYSGSGIKGGSYPGSSGAQYPQQGSAIPGSTGTAGHPYPGQAGSKYPGSGLGGHGGSSIPGKPNIFGTQPTQTPIYASSGIIGTGIDSSGVTGIYSQTPGPVLVEKPNQPTCITCYWPSQSPGGQTYGTDISGHGVTSGTSIYHGTSGGRGSLNTTSYIGHVPSIGSTTYHGGVTPTSGYSVTTGTGAGAIVTGHGIQGTIITGDSSQGTLITHGGTSGTVYTGSSDQGSIITGGDHPGYTKTGPGTPGYVISDGVKTVYSGSASPGTVIYGTPSPGVVVTGAPGAGTIIKGQTAPGVVLTGQTAPGIVLTGQTAPGVVLTGHTAPGGYDSGYSTKPGGVTPGSSYGNKIGGVVSTSGTGYKTNEYYDNGGRGTIRFNNGDVTTKYTENDIPDYRPAGGTIPPDTLLPGSKDSSISTGFANTGPTKTSFTPITLGAGHGYTFSTRKPSLTSNTENIGAEAFAGNVAGYTKSSTESSTEVYSGTTLAHGLDIAQRPINLGPSKATGYSYPTPSIPFETGVTKILPIASTESNIIGTATPTPFLNVELYNTPGFGDSGSIGSSTVVNTYQKPSGFTNAPVPTVTPVASIFNIPTRQHPLKEPFVLGSAITPAAGFVHTSTPENAFEQSVTPSGVTKLQKPQKPFQPGVTYQQSILVPGDGSRTYASGQPGYTVSSGSSDGSPTNVDIPRNEVGKLITNYNRGTTKYVPNKYDIYTTGSISGADYSRTQSSSSTIRQGYGPSTPSSVTRTQSPFSVTTYSGGYSRPTSITSYQTTAKSTAVGKAKVIVKWSDLHPLLLGKLGAECTCRGDPFANLRGPGSKLINSSKGKVDLSNYDESEIYVDLEKDGSNESEDYATNYDSSVTKPIKVWNNQIAQLLSSSSSQAQETLSSSYLPSITPSSNLGARASVSGFSNRGHTANFRSAKSLSNVASPTNSIGIAKDFGSPVDRLSGDGESEEIIDGATNCARPGLFRHPNFCSKFYACHWDEWKKKFTLHVFNCPVHLTFDNGAGACNWPSMGPACQDDNLLV